MTGSAATGTKRKKPPTFQHLPVDRAKKLKRSWVEVQKIKSRWRAQKRKEGLTTTRPAVNLRPKEEQDGGDEERRNEEPALESGCERDGSTIPESDGEDVKVRDEESGGGDEKNRELRRDCAEGKKLSKGKGMKVVEAPASRGRRSIRNRRDNATDNDKETKKLTLRELQVLAYSKSSLHTYRSGASRRQDDTRRRGRGLQRDWRGRGQPDMRLRMNAMLEKIKKDFA